MKQKKLKHGEKQIINDGSYCLNLATNTQTIHGCDKARVTVIAQCAGTADEHFPSNCNWTTFYNDTLVKRDSDGSMHYTHSSFLIPVKVEMTVDQIKEKLGINPSTGLIISNKPEIKPPQKERDQLLYDIDRLYKNSPVVYKYYDKYY